VRSFPGFALSRERGSCLRVDMRARRLERR
jgi:hypothetical protein